MQKIPSLALLLSLASCNGPAEAPRVVVLPSGQAKQALAQCSREVPKGVDGTWEISKSIVTQLENDLPKLSVLGAHNWGVAKSAAWDAKAYFRQYAGVTVHGKQYVYINAFLEQPISINRQDRDKWRHGAVLACDGGDGFWGALYDPTTRQFSGLAFNGPA